MNCSPPGSFIHGILKARNLEWAAIPFSRGNSWPRDPTQVFCISGEFFTIWATREAQINCVSVQFSRSVMSDPLWPHESQHASPPCPSPTPGVYSNSSPSSRWCHPAISSSVISCPPVPNPSQHQGLSNESTLLMRWPKYWSFSFSISPSSEHQGLIFFRMDWLDLVAVQGTLKSLLQHHSSKAPILRCSAFFTVQHSHPYMTTGRAISSVQFSFSVMSNSLRPHEPQHTRPPGPSSTLELTQAHVHQVGEVHVSCIAESWLGEFWALFTSMWDECNCVVIWAFFGIAFLWDWNESWPFPGLWLLLSFPNLLAYWVQHFRSIIFQDLK